MRRKREDVLALDPHRRLEGGLGFRVAVEEASGALRQGPAVDHEPSPPPLAPRMTAGQLPIRLSEGGYRGSGLIRSGAVVATVFRRPRFDVPSVLCSVVSGRDPSRHGTSAAGGRLRTKGATLTELLAAHSRGDPDAFDRLVPLVYDDLRRIAHRHLASEREGHTLNTTAVVHEAYLRLAEGAGVSWTDRVHFLAVASRVMRHVLIDYARTRGREKRGGGAVRVPLDSIVARKSERPGGNGELIELLALDQALTRLSTRDRRMGRVVECRLFGGMRMKEIAATLDTSLSTVERDWRRAKAYLYRDLAPESGG